MGRSHQSKTHRLLEHFGILLALATKMFFHNAKYNIIWMQMQLERNICYLLYYCLDTYVVKKLFEIELKCLFMLLLFALLNMPVFCSKTNQNENMFHRLSIKKGGIFLGNYLTN